MSYKSTLKTFNPETEYYNRDKKGDLATNKCTLSDSWSVASNPGFTTMPSSSDNRFLEGTAKGYGKVTGLFNEDYINVKDGNNEPYSKTRSYYYHFGIDFSGSKGDPIVSLIYGKVIAKCWISTNGRCLLVQGKTTNNLFMLCHLSAYADNLKEGDDVSPGMVVAKVGGSGGDKGSYSETAFENRPHLHLSVIRCNKILVLKKEVLHQQESITIEGKKEDHWNWISRTYLDPFDYKFSGGEYHLK